MPCLLLRSYITTTSIKSKKKKWGGGHILSLFDRAIEVFLIVSQSFDRGRRTLLWVNIGAFPPLNEVEAFGGIILIGPNCLVDVPVKKTTPSQVTRKLGAFAVTTSQPLRYHPSHTTAASFTAAPPPPRSYRQNCTS